MQTANPNRRAERRAAQGPDESARAAGFAARHLVERLIGIRNLFVAANGLPLTREAIAEHFEVSLSTVSRDIEMLRRLGAIKTWTDRDGLNVHGYILAEKSKCPFCGKN